MKTLVISLIALIIAGCNKSFIEKTQDHADYSPWIDSSSKHPKNQLLKDLINKYHENGLPGISLLVQDEHGTWTGAKGESDVENHIPFTVSQVSKAASITKLFMGTLLFRMIEDSLVTGFTYSSLSYPITAWLPENIIKKLPNGKMVTLGDCLKHETGIPDIIDQDKFYLAVLNQPNKKWQPEELLEFIFDKEPVFFPRDTAIYSNTNTILVAMILEEASGISHHKLLHQYILEPLALKNTYYHPHDDLPNTVAQGYFDLYNNQTIVNVSNLITGSGNGYGGLYSNIFDLFTFISELLIRKTVLSEKSLSVMQTYGKADFPNQYGYGIMKKYIDRGADAGIGHSGRDLGYTANLFYFPDKGVTHVFFINYGTDSKSELQKVFQEFQEELLNITLLN